MLTDSEIIAHVFAAFRAEQAERRQAIGEQLLDLEREPARPDRRALLDQLFREAHSLKGGARAAGLVGVEQHPPTRHTPSLAGARLGAATRRCGSRSRRQTARRPARPRPRRAAHGPTRR